MMHGCRQRICIALLLGLLWGIATAAADGELVAAQLSFADALTFELYDRENECTSALGVSMAFDLIYPSATGQARLDLEAVFGFSSSSSEQISTHQFEDTPVLQWDDTVARLQGIYRGDCLPPRRVTRAAGAPISGGKYWET